MTRVTPDWSRISVRVQIPLNKSIDGEKHYSQVPVCRSSTGWHCCFRPCRQSTFNQFGVGVTLYFKMLKFLIVMFTIGAIINIPMYILYAGGSD